MGGQLIYTYATFRASLEKSEQILNSLGAPWSLMEEILRDPSTSRINEGEIAQPATTALQIAMVDLLHLFGIRPTVVIGHSSGEIAAAYAAKALSQRSALSISFYRGSLVPNSAIKKGAMLAVGLGEEDVMKHVSQIKTGKLSVACVNSPSSTTISGDESAIWDLQGILRGSGIFNRMLKVSVAYHSHHMQDVAVQYRKALETIDHGSVSSSVKFISSVSSIRKTKEFGPSYWVKNLLLKVRYSAAIQNIVEEQARGVSHGTRGHLFIEIGPHSALAGPTNQTIKNVKLDSFQYQYIPSLVRDQDSVHTIMQLAGRLFELGYPVNVEAVNRFEKTQQLPTVVSNLPPYPWDHSKKYWYESRLSKVARFRKHPYHDLLGTRMSGGGFHDLTWRHIISLQNLPWLRDHVIGASVVFPGAGFLCMAMEAIRQVAYDHRGSATVRQYKLRDIVFSKPLIIPEPPSKVEVQIAMIACQRGFFEDLTTWNGFSVSSISLDGAISEHCRGTISVAFGDSAGSIHEETLASTARQEIFHKAKESCTKRVQPRDFYRELHSKGNTYGSKFAILEDFHACDFQATGKLTVPNVAKCMPSEFMQPHIIHPTTLDSLFQALAFLLLRQSSFGCAMPTSIKEVLISADLSSEVGEEILIGANIALEGRRNAIANAVAFQKDECSEMKPIISFLQTELCATEKLGESSLGSSGGSEMSYQMEWAPDVDFLSSFSNGGSGVEPSREGQWSLPEQKLEYLNSSATLYIKRCLGRLDDENLAVVDKHMLYFVRWMRRHMASPSTQRVLANFGRDKVNTDEQGADKYTVESEILSRIGENLLPILTGKVDALSLLLQDDLLSRFYLEDESSKQCCTHLINYLKHLFFKKPSLKVLEIGAGTGGTTLPLLRSLGENSRAIREYDYTDISCGFFGAAQSLLREWSDTLHFKNLDIECDPLDQGFQEESYDLIVACNVLHATEKMDTTLKHVRKLLKPGGKLGLIEVTRTVPWINLFAGVLPGWWRGFEDGRKDSPVSTVEQWHDMLLRNSFSGITFSAQDFDSPASKATMMISNAVEVREKASNNVVQITLTSATEDRCRHFGAELSSAITKDGYHCDIEAMPVNEPSRHTIHVILDFKANSILLDSNTERFNQFTKLLIEGKQILWISLCEDSTLDKDPGGLMTGMARVARSEKEGMRLVTLDVQQALGVGNRRLVQAISDILRSSFDQDTDQESVEYEYIYTDDQVFIPRLVPKPQINTLLGETREEMPWGMDHFHHPDRPLKLEVKQPGLLDSLMFVDDESALDPLHPNQLEIQVRACGINFKDVFVALGKMKRSTQMTGECAGIVTAVGSNLEARYHIGDRVCGWNGTPYASNVRMNGGDVCKLPEALSFSVGASIPVNFMTAYYSLVEMSHLQKGQSVLVHAASGGVGQVAIMVAKHIGAEVFATAGSDEKRKVIVHQYQIPESHVFSSQSTSFKDGIMRITEGRGVEVILNSSSGLILQESWHCIAEFGTFIELGKTDIYQKGQIDMEPFDKNVTFASLDLVSIARHRSQKLQQVFATVMSLFEKGVLKPVEPVTTMPISDIERAFRHIQGRKHIGKIVLEAGEDSMVKAIAAKPKPLRLEKNGTYVVAGGLEDIGQSICRLMARSGAGNIVILSRREVLCEQQRAMEEEMACHRTKLYIKSCDISDEASVKEVAKWCRETIPPIRGVIQAAVVLQDRVLEQMNPQDFKAGLLPKYHGTINLSQAFESPSLDFFIMLSSLSGILGVKSQASYASGSVFQDSFAHSKADSHTNYLSLDLGMIEDTDTVASYPERRASLLREGFIPLKLEQVLRLLNYCMSPQARQDRLKQITIGFNRQSLVAQQCTVNLRNPLFNHLPLDTRTTTSSEPTKQKSTQSLDATISAAKDINEIHTIIANALKTQLSTLIALDIEKIHLDVPMSALGLDSLITIELRNWIGRHLKAGVQAGEILDQRDWGGLVEVVVGRSGIVGGWREKGGGMGGAGRRGEERG
ncbi:hypothetical protein ACLMJK_007024 [Lecanora helva]